MSAPSLALAPTLPTQGLVLNRGFVARPTEEASEQDLLAALLTSSQAGAGASALLRTFPSIGHVITAEPSQLRAFGLAERDIAVFRLVREIACRMARAEVRGRPVLSNWQALIRLRFFCRSTSSLKSEWQLSFGYGGHSTAAILARIQRRSRRPG